MCLDYFKLTRKQLDCAGAICVNDEWMVSPRLQVIPEHRQSVPVPAPQPMSTARLALWGAALLRKTHEDLAKTLGKVASTGELLCPCCRRVRG